MCFSLGNSVAQYIDIYLVVSSTGPYPPVRGKKKTIILQKVSSLNCSVYVFSKHFWVWCYTIYSSLLSQKNHTCFFKVYASQLHSVIWFCKFHLVFHKTAFCKFNLESFMKLYFSTLSFNIYLWKKRINWICCIQTFLNFLYINLSKAVKTASDANILIMFKIFKWINVTFDIAQRLSYICSHTF